MRIFRWIAVAFSMYSRIPMPVFEWKEGDMSGGLMFLPLIGAVIGGVSTGVYYAANYFELPGIVTILLLGLVPLIITGGFHVDGFMDVTDALRSYQPKEKKLEILKDPHIGAFAVIGLVTDLLFYAIGLDLIIETGSLRHILCYAGIFVIMRALVGISSVTMKKAKNNGMLYEETKGKNKAVIIVLAVQMIPALGVMAYFDPVVTVLVTAMCLPVLACYGYTAKKQFGGVTGDTAGYLLTIGETVLTVTIGVAARCGL